MGALFNSIETGMPIFNGHRCNGYFNGHKIWRNEPSFEKSGDVVLNPGQGWVLYGSPIDYNPATLALGSTAYWRWRWSLINPQENVYDWSVIDNYISMWTTLGKQFAFSINLAASTYNSSILHQVPMWVFDKGAQYTMGNGTASTSTDRIFYIPVWDDPVYVAECAKFVEKLAERYDGNPSIPFIDIRAYGNFGEMHMSPFSQYTQHLTAEQVQNLLIQPYIDNFKKTKLVICWGAPPLNNSINYWAVNNGIGLRRDGIMGNMQTAGSSGNGDEIAMAIGKEPVVWEFLYGDFSNLENHPVVPWDDNRFMNNIRNYKPNYIGIGGWGGSAQYFLSKKPNLVPKAANLMGFNFSMTAASYPNVVPAGSIHSVSISIENSGTTIILSPCVIKLVLLDDNSAVISSFITNWDAKTIQGFSTEMFQTNVSFPSVPVGNYKLAIGFFKNSTDINPTYNLDNKGRTHNGFYIVGDYTIT